MRLGQRASVLRKFVASNGKLLFHVTIPRLFSYMRDYEKATSTVIKTEAGPLIKHVDAPLEKMQLTTWHWVVVSLFVGEGYGAVQGAMSPCCFVPLDVGGNKTRSFLVLFFRGASAPRRQSVGGLVLVSCSCSPTTRCGCGAMHHRRDDASLFFSFSFLLFYFPKRETAPFRSRWDIAFLLSLTWPVDGPRNFLHRLFFFLFCCSFLLVRMEELLPTSACHGAKI